MDKLITKKTERVGLKIGVWFLLVLLVLLGRAGVSVPEAVENVCINEILVDNVSANLDPDFKEFSGWIEIYNYGSKEVKLGGYYLTDNLRKPRKWKIPSDTIIQAKEFALLWTDKEDIYRHTNFKLNHYGGVLCLTNPDGRIIDELAYTSQIPDVSFGRKPDGGSNWFYFAAPTPKAGNTSQHYGSQKRVTLPTFSLPGGFYATNQILQITAPSSAVIRYTTDGSIPTEESALYISPLRLDSTRVIRARAFHPRLLSSPTVTHTYFINERFTLPVVSLAINPPYLWNDKIGIYVKGENAEPKFPYWGSNFLEKWERPVGIEFYEPNGKLGLSVEAGARTAGTTSLAAPVKSLAVRLRKKYGTTEVDYKLFNNRPFTIFKSFLLRNSGEDWASTVFCDSMIKKLFEGRMDIDYQVSRPVIVFINGEYWGIHYLSEKIDEFFLASNHGLDYKIIDLLAYYPDPENRVFRRVIAGNADEYDRLMNFIETHDLSITENYRYVETQIDIDEYLDYTIAEIYIANEDWPGGNLKLWKPRIQDGKWRWILYDTGIAFGLYAPYSSDTIQHATAVAGKGWANPPQSTLLLRKLLENAEFKDDFIQRTASHLNTTFRPDRIMKVIESCQAEIEPEMPRFIEKWKGQASAYENLKFPSTVQQWKTNIERLRTFAGKRPLYLRQHVVNDFRLSGTANLTLQVANPEGGRVFVGGVLIPEANFTGVYFKGVPLKMAVVPNRGYRFHGWGGISARNSDSVSVILKKDTLVKAVFEPVSRR